MSTETQTSKITKNPTQAQVKAQKAKRRLTPCKRKKPEAYRYQCDGTRRKKAGGTVKKMSAGGMTSRGMGAATRGGKFKIR